MEQPASNTGRIGWLESSGLVHLCRIPRLACRLDTLGLGLAGIIMTVALGTALDWVWSVGGGVAENALDQFIMDRQLKREHVEPAGDFGVFQVWRKHERRCVLGLLGSAIPFKSLAGGTGLGQYVESHSSDSPLANVVKIGQGFWWLVRQHPIYALLFTAGVLLIWSWAGGAICRIVAAQFARNEVLSLQQGELYARQHLGGGFALAPCIPLGMMAVTALFLVLGGMVLWIPWLGDVIGGLLFFLALFGGAVIAALLVGLLTAGHLFWPAVAADGTDGFDAFSRGFSYLFSRPWRALAYAVFSTVYTAVCWIAANLFMFLALMITRNVVSFGTAPFGWWGRREFGSESLTKLQLLWPVPDPDILYQAPVWDRLGVFEHFSAVMIALWVLLLVAVLWSMLTSLYFSACTVCYFLLRRDVDGTDLGDLFVEEDDSEAAADEPATAS